MANNSIELKCELAAKMQVEAASGLAGYQFATGISDEDLENNAVIVYAVEAQAHEVARGNFNVSVVVQVVTLASDPASDRASHMEAVALARDSVMDEDLPSLLSGAVPDLSVIGFQIGATTHEIEGDRWIGEITLELHAAMRSL